MIRWVSYPYIHHMVQVYMRVFRIWRYLAIFGDIGDDMDRVHGLPSISPSIIQFYRCFRYKYSLAIQRTRMMSDISTSLRNHHRHRSAFTQLQRVFFGARNTTLLLFLQLFLPLFMFRHNLIDMGQIILTDLLLER